MAALTQPVSDMFHTTSEDCRSSQYLQDAEKPQDRPTQNKPEHQESEHNRVSEDWPQNIHGCREGSKGAPRQE